MPGQYELLPRNSSDIDNNAFKDKPVRRRYHNLLSLPLAGFRKSRRVCRPLFVFPAIVVFFLWQITFNASYTNPPPFIPHPSETVYIAANIIDGHLVEGAWGASLLDLIDTIGRDRVYVSIYGGPTDALKHLEAVLECEHSIVSEEEHPIALSSIPHTKLPTGEERIKRISYLAEVRNKALEPLNTLTRHFDRVLFINDVFFSPDDATRLLWGTNVNMYGKAEYKAVCAADFITSWKYYDTYGTRDFEGYSIGVPIFPWFANEGDALSRRDVLAGRDMVRVKSCWGGMVAFDARYFQNAIPEPARQIDIAHLTRDVVEPSPLTLPLRFRSEPEPFWDSSECCLIHADIMALPPFPSYSEQATAHKPLDWQAGIFLNPYVRVSYSAGTQRWIWLAKRFERLFTVPQAIINHMAHMPRFNYRRTEREGEVVHDRIWVSTKNNNYENPGQERGLDKRATLGSGRGKAYWAGEGHYEDFNRTATRGGYCGVRQLLVLREGNTDKDGNWDNLLDQVPPLDI